MEFELKVQAPKTQPVVFNYEELKAGLSTALADYKDRVYDESMIAEAKADKAKLNKLGNALNSERITREKEYMKPFSEFKEQVAELIGMIKEATTSIDNQLAEFEEKRIEEKRTAIRELFSEIASKYDALDFITLDKIFNDKWLNKTATDKAIATEITERFEKAAKDLEVISRLPYYYEAKECYKTTLDLNKALSEGERIAQIQEAKRQAALLKAQEEIEARKHIDELNALPKEEATSEPIPEAEPTYEVAFKCRVTRSQAIALKDFCTKNGITLINIK